MEAPAMIPMPTDRNALRQQLDALLRQQTQAAHEGDAEQLALLSEESLRYLHEMQRRVKADLTTRPDRRGGQDRQPLGWIGDEQLLRFRDIATYNQLLLRYSFTSWAARCIDRGRRRYNAQGRLADGEGGAGRGQLSISKGVL